jgi:hypothetical protein
VSIDLLLSHLEGARRTGPDRYIAKCPAHEDRSPSLSVRELADGRILLHCFAGCDVGAIVAALGMKLSDLFPPTNGFNDSMRRAPERRPFSSDDALHLVEFELYFVVVSARKLAEGRALESDEHERLLIAVDRTANARQACGLLALR